MRIVVLGPGAVGSLLAGCLALAGHSVTLLGRTATGGSDPGRVRLLRPGGARDEVAVGRAAGATALLGRPDVAVLAVKQPDLPEAAAALAAWPEVVAMTVQNGIGAEELVVEQLRGGGLVAASLTAAVELASDGAVHWLRRGGIGLARAGGDVGATAEELASAFAEAGLQARVLPDARAMKWSKLLANLAGNATSAIVDMDPRAVFADVRLFRVEQQQHREALAVMRGLGLRPVRLPGANVPLLVRGFRLPGLLARPLLSTSLGGARGGKMPSLRRAVRAGWHPTESAWLNGAVAGAAAGVGLQAPVNARLSELVEEVAADEGRRAWLRGRPDRLEAELARPGSRWPADGPGAG